MFGRHVEVRFAKTKKTPTPDTAEKLVVAEELRHMAEDLGKKALIGVLSVMAASFVLRTAEHLIINATSKN